MGVGVGEAACAMGRADSSGCEREVFERSVTSIVVTCRDVLQAGGLGDVRAVPVRRVSRWQVTWHSLGPLSSVCYVDIGAFSVAHGYFA
jgi:hypothetical protein